jgi:hypothetical protein
MIRRNRTVACVAASAFVSVLSSCGDSGSAGSMAGPIKRCVSLWNSPTTNHVQGVATLLANDLAGTPAALVQTRPDGRCEVLFGAVGSLHVLNAFVYDSTERTYIEDKALEGPLIKSPPWNAKPNGDGTLSAGRP